MKWLVFYLGLHQGHINIYIILNKESTAKHGNFINPDIVAYLIK